MASPLFCFSCNSIQRLNAQPNFFEMFSLPYTYELDLKQLEERYEQLVIELHPDFYAHSTGIDKRQSQESSAWLNQAYTALKEPLSRAEYLLELLTHGKKFDQRRLPDGFLEEVFVLQESLEDLLEDAGDAASVERFRLDIVQRLEQLQTQISEQFSQIEQDTADWDESLEAIQLNLNVGRYLQRLLDRISRSQQT
ncbi:MAG: Fe-S protein assembly co-chaperone HscB [SAR324 cluster bacterium]|nr:Fe-S protein assembly co-chaperone HscB [SAR324 cluster bacterium]